jgi:hypothetical protein
VNFEWIVLAVLNAGRPAGIAAVYALLLAKNPVRLLAAYIAVGFVWSFAIGLIVVRALHGAEISGSSTATAVISLGLGAAAMGFAAAFASGKVTLRAPGRLSGGDGRMSRTLRDPSLKVAAGAGIATHLPGLFYLLGLNAISDTDPNLLSSVVDVLGFNVIWFAVPIAAQVMAVRHPERARAALEAFNAWVRDRQRGLAILAFSAIGAYFAVKGAVELL